MNNPTTYCLTRDAVSYKGKLYAPAGTAVTIINQRGNVYIVERQDGFRFPIAATEVAGEPAEIEETSPTPIIKQHRGRRPKAEQHAQTNLF